MKECNEEKLNLIKGKNYLIRLEKGIDEVYFKKYSKNKKCVEFGFAAAIMVEKTSWFELHEFDIVDIIDKEGEA